MRAPSVLRPLAALLASLRVTVMLLVLSILLVFAATLDQVHLGVWGVQQKYFHSFWVFSQVPGAGVALPIFPGGYCLGLLLLANLVAAHLTRFRLRAANAGLWLTHLGLILLLAGEGISGLLQQDSQMRIDVGQTRRYAESFRATELAVVETTAPDRDTVIAIPSGLIEEQRELQHPRLPFAIKPIVYYPNARLRMRGANPDGPPAVATLGDGVQVAAQPAPVTYKPNESNWPTAYLELRTPEGPIGTLLVSTMLVGPQTLTYQGRTWEIALRPQRDYLPAQLTLERFTHDVYPGTQIPKDFASTVRLRSDDRRDDRQVRIFMNNPLRVAGRAIYQAGYDNNDRTSVLQVVRNPAWLMPYVACSVIALGLALQFGLHLFRFARRRRPAPVPPTPAVLLPPLPSRP